MARDTEILSDNDLHRFARQLILNGFADEHQLALFKSHVCVIGAGGLGAPLIQYLAAAGIGTITIFDDDVVELTNLNRQIIHSTKDIGKDKTDSAFAMITALDPSITVNLHNERFKHDQTSNNDFTVICDASDNAETRHAANNFAHSQNIPLIFGGAVRMEGQLAVFRSGIDEAAPCYQCLFPENTNSDLVAGCSEAGIIGAITGIIGSMMALEAIRQCLITHEIENPLGEGIGQNLILFDGRSMVMDKIKLMKNQNCPCCGTSKNST